MSRLAYILAATALVATTVPATAASPAKAGGEEKLAKLLEGREAGKPVNCLDMRRVSSTQVIDGTAIVYQVGSQLFVNRPTIGASSLRRDDVLVTKSFDSRLCNVDSLRLLDQGSRFERGFVGLGQFVPYGKRAARG